MQPKDHPQRPRVFTDLPDELVLGILSAFEPMRTFGESGHIRLEEHQHEENQQRIKCLAALCLTSQECKRLAQPLLYTTLIVQTARPYQLYTFARTLIENPHLAKRIKYIERTLSDQEFMQKRINEEFDYLDWDTAIVPKLIGSASSVWKTGERDGLFEWETLLREYAGEDAALTLIIALATNLEQLDISHQAQFGRAFWSVLGLDRYSYDVHEDFLQLGRLRDVAIHQHADHKRPFGSLPTDVTLHKSLPALRSLHVDGQIIPKLRTAVEEPLTLPAFAHLKHVYLDYTTASQEEIVEIIRGCRELNSFRCKWDWWRRISFADQPALLHELSAHSQTLRHLWLSNLFMKDYYARQIVVPAIESLTHLTCLEHLRLDHAGFFGAPCGLQIELDGDYWRLNRPQRFSTRLPKSLKTLAVYCRFPVYNDTLAFRDLAEDCEQLPALEKVRIFQPRPYDPDLHHLAQQFKAHGVELEVVRDADVNA